jgi:hypothetical protein
MLSAPYLNENAADLVLDNAERSAYIIAMTIDERIEALTQSVELLAMFHRDSNAKMERLALMQAETENRVVRVVESLNAFGARVDQAMAEIAQIFHDHEERITALEGK